MESNWHGDGWDGSKCMRERVGMDLKCVRTGGGGTKISSPCRSLVSILDFTGAKDDGNGGDNWSCKTFKAPVKLSPPTNQHPTFYRLDALPVAQPTMSELWRETVRNVIITKTCLCWCVCVCSIWLWTLNWWWEDITDMPCHLQNTSLPLSICILTLSTCSCLFCQLLDMHEAIDGLSFEVVSYIGMHVWILFCFDTVCICIMCIVSIWHLLRSLFLVFNMLICIYNIYYLCQGCQCVQLLCLSVSLLWNNSKICR